MKDLFDRPINYLRISVTEHCNYNCRYCKPAENAFYDNEILTDEEIIKIVQSASEIGITKIRLTGGEPLVRKGIVSLIKKIKEIDGIKEITMTTNASLLVNQVKTLKEAGLKRVNISLDSLDPIKFKYITNGGKLQDVLTSIDQLLAQDMKPVKLNVVLMKDFNDEEIIDFVNLTKNKDIIVRFIELMPIGSHDFNFKKHYLNTDEVIKRCPDLIKEQKAHQDTATYYKLPDAKGKVGLISAVSHDFCASCNRIRITSDGKIKPCLHSNYEIDLLEALRNEKDDLNDVLEKAILRKPKSHKINKKDFEKVKRNMYRIGG